MATEFNIICPDEKTKQAVLRNMQRREWNYPLLYDTPSGILAISVDDVALFYPAGETVPDGLQIENLGRA